MTKATTANPSRRSWTDGQSATSNRKSMLAFLSILVAALTIAFVWFVFNFGKKEETFLLPLSVSSYAKNIPKANYGIWDPSAFDEKLKSNGLKPWTFSAPAKLENQPQIIARLASFVDELKAKRRDPAKSTVLVQLRCHAVVTDNGKDEWSCGLFVGESAAPAAMFPVSELLAKLNEIPAGNIVIFADVCDLKGVASNGWLSNPVTSYFKNACESWKKQLKEKPLGGLRCRRLSRYLLFGPASKKRCSKRPVKMRFNTTTRRTSTFSTILSRSIDTAKQQAMADRLRS